MTPRAGVRSLGLLDQWHRLRGRLAGTAPDEHETVRNLRREHRRALIGLFALWWAHARSERRRAQTPAEQVRDVLRSREGGDPDVCRNLLLVREVRDSGAATSRAVEAPPVVGALQVAVLGDAAHRKRQSPVRADVIDRSHGVGEIAIEREVARSEPEAARMAPDVLAEGDRPPARRDAEVKSRSRLLRRRGGRAHAGRGPITH